MEESKIEEQRKPIPPFGVYSLYEQQQMELLESILIELKSLQVLISERLK